MVATNAVFKVTISATKKKQTRKLFVFVFVLFLQHVSGFVLFCFVGFRSID